MANSNNILLGFGALLFLGISVGGFFAPGELVATYDLASASPNADNELRAVFGGMCGALGAYFAWTAASAERHRSGLVLFSLVFGGLTLARLVSLLLVGLPSGLMLAIHGLEAGAMVAGVWSLGVHKEGVRFG